jgi:hypothetical protein
MQIVWSTINSLLVAHEPNPSLVIDQHWTLIAANQTLRILLKDVAPELLKEPVNVLRVSLHPNGLAPRIKNLREWREHVLLRLRRQQNQRSDPILSRLLQEISDYPGGTSDRRTGHVNRAIAIPLKLELDNELLTFFSIATVFGGPFDITLSELSIETFLPADQTTSEILKRLHS